MRGRLLTLVGSALLAATAAAEPPDPFEAKVRALAHPRYAEREKAARDLEAAGEPALKALRAAQTSGDEELRARAAAVAERIDRAVRSQRLLTAPKLAIKLDRVPLRQAVTEVAQKTGLRLMLDPAKDADPRRLVTVDTGEVPFWEAVHAFYAAAGLTEAHAPAPAENPPQPAMGRRQQVLHATGLSLLGGPIRLVDGKAEAPAATGHALRVRALPAAYPQNKYDATTGEVTLHLAVDAVPALALQEVIGVEVRRAVAENRRALAPAYPAPAAEAVFGPAELMVARQVIIIDGELMTDSALGGPHLPVTLKTGPARPKRLAELEGVVVARVLAPPEPLLTVADVFGKGKGETVKADRLSCQVTAVEETATHPVPPPRVRPAPGARAAERPADAGPAPAAVRVRVTSTAATEVLNFPVQLKGRVRPFLRINRRSGELGGHGPEFQLRDADGKPLRLLSTGLMESRFDGTNLTQEVLLTFEKPAKGVAGVSLTLTGRRPTVVGLPFVLKDVPLP